jgi:hypothetical protein
VIAALACAAIFAGCDSSDDQSNTTSTDGTPPAETVPPPDVTTTVPDTTTQPAQETGDRWGPVTLSLDPIAVPAVVGPVEIQVHAITGSAVMVMSCPALGGVLGSGEPYFSMSDCGNVPERFESANQMREMGALRNPGASGESPTPLTVFVDQQMIDTGAVVIYMSDMFVSPIGSAILTIEDSIQS